MQEQDAPRLLLAFLSAAALVVAAVVVAGLVDSYWAVAGAVLVLVALLAVVLGEIGHELREED